MAKIITINNISLKEFSISKTDGKINVRLLYSLLDEIGKEYDQKSDSIKDEELTATQKTKINEILSFIETKIKQREEIN
jgi:hypothetical protein